MGIRLVCPQGHKLHVKAFLAGKRAICPHCGEKVLVPPGNETPAAASLISQETTIDLADVPASAPGAASQSRVTTVPGQAAPAVVAHSRPSAAAPVVAAAATIPPAPVAASDPLADNANAVWYVRPKTGGQFGPAPGPMMRQWIAESRVAGDSLVWREGWSQWKLASEVFAELGAGAIAAPMPVGGLVSGGAPAGTTAMPGPAVPVATSVAVRYHARRRSTGRLVALIVVLGLLVLSLALVLVYVVQNRNVLTRLSRVHKTVCRVWRLCERNRFGDSRRAATGRQPGELRAVSRGTSRAQRLNRGEGIVLDGDEELERLLIEIEEEALRKAEVSTRKNRFDD